MYEIFLPIGEATLDPWRSHRLFSACRAFTRHLDPDFTAKAIYDDERGRQGWSFLLATAEARDRLAAFHDQLHGEVLAEFPSRHDPVTVGDRDAASAIYAG